MQYLAWALSYQHLGITLENNCQLVFLYSWIGWEMRLPGSQLSRFVSQYTSCIQVSVKSLLIKKKKELSRFVTAFEISQFVRTYTTMLPQIAN